MLLEELHSSNEELLTNVSDFPVKAYTDTVGAPHIKTVLKQASGNLVYGFKTDFSNSSYLYGYYKVGLESYCKNNSIPINDDLIRRNASLAVDTFNQVCGDEATSMILPFQMAQSKLPVKISLVLGAMIVACYLLIKRINYGDYFTFSYVGMSIIVAGAVLIFLPIFALIMDYPSMFNLTDVEAYNYGISMCIADVLRILSITGAVLTIVGIISMNIIYNRYRNIVMSIRTEMEIGEKLRKEFMEEQLKFEMGEFTIVDNLNKPSIDNANVSIQDENLDIDNSLVNVKRKKHKKKK